MKIFAISIFLLAVWRASTIRSLPAKDLALIQDQPAYCKREWPQVDFFLPLMIRTEGNSARNTEAIHFFLLSYFTFFPISLANTTVIFVVDEEVKYSREFADFQKILRQYIQTVKLPSEPRVRIEFNSPSKFYNSGYDRQQLIKLFADNYTTSEYVGIVDSDCIFMTYVDREDLFENNKPVVNGRIGWYGYTLPKGKNHYNPNYLWPNATLALLGHKEPIRCMSYFPIIFKTVHVRKFREFVSRRVNSHILLLLISILIDFVAIVVVVIIVVFAALQQVV